MGGVFRRRLQRTLDHLGHLFIRHRARATGPVFVSETFDPVPHKTPAPFANGVLMYAKLCGHPLARQAIGTKQDHTTAIRQRPRCLVTPHLTLKKASLVLAKHHRIRHTSHHRIIS